MSSVPVLRSCGVEIQLIESSVVCTQFEILEGKYDTGFLSLNQRAEVSVYACGPHPMLGAVARLAQDYALPCQVSLEEYMACAVGGCAGCTVQLTTPAGTSMKRVCVDGPVFDAALIDW